MRQESRIEVRVGDWVRVRWCERQSWDGGVPVACVVFQEDSGVVERMYRSSTGEGEIRLHLESGGANDARWLSDVVERRASEGLHK